MEDTLPAAVAGAPVDLLHRPALAQVGHYLVQCVGEGYEDDHLVAGFLDNLFQCSQPVGAVDVVAVTELVVDRTDADLQQLEQLHRGVGGADIHALHVRHQGGNHGLVGCHLIRAQAGHAGLECDWRKVQAMLLLEPDARLQDGVGPLVGVRLRYPFVLGHLQHGLVAELGEELRVHALAVHELGQSPGIGRVLRARRASQQPHPAVRRYQTGQQLVALGLRVAELRRLVDHPQVDILAFGQLVLDDLQPVVVDDVDVHVGAGQLLEPARPVAAEHRHAALAEEVGTDLVLPDRRHGGLRAYHDGLLDDAALHQVVGRPQGG
ncbi:hypothetical protein D3C81_1288470 [compost metagenome]